MCGTLRVRYLFGGYALIDALFGSKTRVKLLYLFLNNPGKSFYVREITRLIDEQINSVRRELANMLKVGIITSDTADNKLFYEVNQHYQYYAPFRAIFADTSQEKSQTTPTQQSSEWQKELRTLAGARVVVLAGSLVQGAASEIDMLIAGSVKPASLKKIISGIEKRENREINYALLSYDDFYYRLSMRDKFIGEVINGKHETIVDTEHILK